MKKTFFTVVLFFILSNLVAQNTKNKINWITFNQLSDSLQTNPKKVLLFLHTDWCTYCKKMMRETFANQTVVDKINTEYYAVHFDAESIDTVLFDNVTFYNKGNKKKRGQYHQIVTLLTQQDKPVFPSILLLKEDFTKIKHDNKYLSVKGLIEFL